MSVKGFKKYDEQGNLIGLEKYDYESLDNLPDLTPVDNLTTSSTKKSLSANQGVVLKTLINSLQNLVDTIKTSFESHSTKTDNPHNVTKSQVNLDNVDNVKQMPIAGGTFTGAVTCDTTLRVSGTATMGRIDASNEYLTGSLYVGGKSSTTDGKTGVAFGASGNITMQGSSTPTLAFITGTDTSAKVKLVANTSNQLVVTGDIIASSTNRATDGGCLRNIEVRTSSATGTLQSTDKIIMVRK